MIEQIKNMITFGIAGNIAGHLEQAGESKDFTKIVCDDKNAPKAIFPTYFPNSSNKIPEFLNIFPFSFDEIIFPTNEEKLQIEPECAIIFDISWENNKIIDLKPISFGASNDCSIRKDGAKKISEKKNWGKSSKGISNNFIKIDSFNKNGNIDEYKIASFLIRDNKINSYGETSLISDYNYIYEKLINWIIDKLNKQVDIGPTENLNEYMISINKTNQILISIGATRYTEYGLNHFLQKGDISVVVLYPKNVYKDEEIINFIKNKDFSHKDISILYQIVK